MPDRFTMLQHLTLGLHVCVKISLLVNFRLRNHVRVRDDHNYGRFYRNRRKGTVFLNYANKFDFFVVLLNSFLLNSLGYRVGDERHLLGRPCSRESSTWDFAFVSLLFNYEL